MTILIDGNKINDLKSFHEFIRNELEFPEYYGNNLDALYDCLTGWIDLPLTIKWVNFNMSQKKLGDEYSSKILNTLKQVEEELGDEFKLEIEI